MLVSKTSPEVHSTKSMFLVNTQDILNRAMNWRVTMETDANKKCAILQLVQNSAARILSRTPFNEHISPVLQQLHWLAVKYRVEFKILLLTYKALHNLAPQYLNQLHVYTPSRALRSSSSISLVVPRIRLTTMGARSYSYAAPRLWNSLPLDIRNSNCLLTFKTRLKTYLFRQAFLWYVLLSLYCTLPVYVQSLLCVLVFCSDLYFLFYLLVWWPWVFWKAP